MSSVSHGSVTTIVAVVAAYYGVSPAQLIAPGRTPLLVEARQVAVQLLFEAGAGASAAGRAIGRDHSTAIYALRCMEARMTHDAWEALQACRREVRSRLDSRATAVAS